MNRNYKTILITGASSGFGKATAEVLAKEGYKLILIARRIENLKKIKSKLGSNCLVYNVDVTDKNAVTNLFTNFPDDFKDIDILINNAGLAAGLDLAQDSSLEDWEAMINTNNLGLVYCTHFALQVMKIRNSGLIINIGSVAASAPYPKGNVYGATKAFVRQFSRNLRADLIGTNIKVSNIEPGMAETEFSIVRFKGDIEKANKLYENTRFLKAEDIANTIKWIIDQPENVNIDNIEIMPIDQTFGGLVIHRTNPK
ncbi:MAG: SDR family NAD(P)-dependent oxidoreductase [bacterium]